MMPINPDLKPSGAMGMRVELKSLRICPHVMFSHYTASVHRLGNDGGEGGNAPFTPIHTNEICYSAAGHLLRVLKTGDN
jgi:hypothetical protein